MVFNGAVEVPVAGGSSDYARVREARERVRDRRALGPDQLAEHPVGERKRKSDAGRLDATPAGCQVPEEEDKPCLEPGLGGDRSQHVEIGDPPSRTCEERLDDLGPGSHAFGELRIEQGEPSRAQRAEGLGPFEQVLGERSGGLEQVAGSDQLGRGPIADARIDRDQPIEDQQAEAATDGREPGREITLANLRVEDSRGCDLAGSEAHPDIELLREVVVGVEQIGIERRRERLPSPEMRVAGPPRRSSRGGLWVFGGYSAASQSLWTPDASAASLRVQGRAWRNFVSSRPFVTLSTEGLPKSSSLT